MRLNLILNGLVHSLPHVVHDDTLISPRHLNDKKDNIATFDYIVSIIWSQNHGIQDVHDEDHNLLAA